MFRLALIGLVACSPTRPSPTPEAELVVQHVTVIDVERGQVVADRDPRARHRDRLIAPGKRADLVLLAANPLDDVANAGRIELVIAKGVPQR